MVEISHSPARSIVGISTFRDEAAFATAWQHAFGIAVPTRPICIQAGPYLLSCLGPGRYSAAAARDAALVTWANERFAGVAAVTDQSDLWVGFLLHGADARLVLSKVVTIDLDQFRPGDVAATRAGHVDVRLWSFDDNYELTVARSYAPDLRHMLQSASGQAEIP